VFSCQLQTILTLSRIVVSHNLRCRKNRRHQRQKFRQWIQQLSLLLVMMTGNYSLCRWTRNLIIVGYGSDIDIT